MKRCMYSFVVKGAACLAVYAILLLSCIGAEEVPRNVVLMIGDGMGMAQLTAGGTVKGVLNIERMPVGGAVKTHSLDSFVTDSAASATALATGEKTNNGMISVTPDGIPLKTIFEYAVESGKSRGVAVTCSVTHATPAAFVSHAESRNMNGKIAADMASAKLDVMFGGGLAYFMPGSMAGSSRKDEKNLLDVIARRMQIVVDEKQFAGIDVSRPAAALIAPKHPAPSADRTLSLGQMVKKALAILSSNDKGFVLLVEGSQIDWFAHKNDESGIIRETIEFDDAVGAALDFAEKDHDTLVVVTADHETGGMVLLGGSVKGRKVDKAAFSTGHHSGTMVPLFAYGPGAAAFGGLKDNTDIGRLLLDYVKQ